MNNLKEKGSLLTIELTLYIGIALIILFCGIFKIEDQGIAWIMILAVILIQSIDIWKAVSENISKAKHKLNKTTIDKKTISILTKSVGSEHTK